MLFTTININKFLLSNEFRVITLCEHAKKIVIYVDIQYGRFTIRKVDLEISVFILTTHLLDIYEIHENSLYDDKLTLM